MSRVSILLLLCLGCGRSRDSVPCQAPESETVIGFTPDSGVSLPTLLAWGLADQDLTLEFLGDELPTCREGKATGALISITDPLNDELPYTSDLVTPDHGVARVTVRFHPVRTGRHHVTVRFLPIGGTSQRDVLIVQQVAGTPLVLPYYCNEVIRLPGGTLICDEKVLRPDGTLAALLDESVARSAFRDELWATRAQTVAHYREIDAGQLERLEYQSLAEPQSWVKLLGGTGNAIAVTDSALAVVTPDAGGMSVSGPFASIGAPNIQNALRVGDIVYVGGPFAIRDFESLKQSSVCAYARSDTSFALLGACQDLAPSLVGANADGFWTFDGREVGFAAVESDGGVRERVAALRVPEGFTFFRSSPSLLGADQVPIIVTFSPEYAAFVPRRVDGGIELLNLPSSWGSLASANSTAIWWAVGNTTTVYPAP